MIVLTDMSNDDDAGGLLDSGGIIARHTTGLDHTPKAVWKTEAWSTARTLGVVSSGQLKAYVRDLWALMRRSAQNGMYQAHGDYLTYMVGLVVLCLKSRDLSKRNDA